MIELMEYSSKEGFYSFDQKQIKKENLISLSKDKRLESIVKNISLPVVDMQYSENPRTVVEIINKNGTLYLYPDIAPENGGYAITFRLAKLLDNGKYDIKCLFDYNQMIEELKNEHNETLKNEDSLKFLKNYG